MGKKREYHDSDEDRGEEEKKDDDGTIEIRTEEKEDASSSSSSSEGMRKKKTKTKKKKKRKKKKEKRKKMTTNDDDGGEEVATPPARKKKKKKKGATTTAGGKGEEEGDGGAVGGGGGGIAVISSSAFDDDGETEGGGGTTSAGAGATAAEEAETKEEEAAEGEDDDERSMEKKTKKREKKKKKRKREKKEEKKKKRRTSSPSFSYEGGADGTMTAKVAAAEEGEGGPTSPAFRAEKRKEKKRRKRETTKEGEEEREESSSQKRSISRRMGGADEDDPKTVASSATEYLPPSSRASSSLSTTSTPPLDVTLLLFYQYVEPPWDEKTFQTALSYVQSSGEKHGLTGRMRVSREGLNCTLTGSYDGIRKWCADLRSFRGGEFRDTEFKLTDHLPRGQLFPKLNAFRVDELVKYGLAGSRAPSLSMTGTHLEPDEYHRKMSEGGTVIIDVRNHYEAAIGRFDPPREGATWIDPKMRKSTEFPVWLDKPETKEKLRGKQVLMYCTGGVRCERASALLRTKMETEGDAKELGIRGVYQLQGGIDKYFKRYPEGGFWKGKNYTFDKRFAHAPPLVEGRERSRARRLSRAEEEEEKEGNVEEEKKEGNLEEEKRRTNDDDDGDPDEKGAIDRASTSSSSPPSSEPSNGDVVMGRCESCRKPWDMYRGKRRCPTCGVPSLVCRECFDADRTGMRPLGSETKCDLCVEEGVTSKRELREREREELRAYEAKELRRGRDDVVVDGNEDEATTLPARRRNDGAGDDAPAATTPSSSSSSSSNPRGITRLFLKNLCVKSTTEETLLRRFPNITHVVCLTDRRTGKFYGSAFAEMATPEDATRAVASTDGKRIAGRIVRAKLQEADPKDLWPPPDSAVRGKN